MARRLATVIAEFSETVRESKMLAIDARSWSVPIPPATTPMLKAKRRDALTELAFFRVFGAWEAFLEEAFILYLRGQQAPRGRPIQRYGFPPSEDAAYEWVAEGHGYASWASEKVKVRAKRLFKSGRPFEPAFTSHHNLLYQLVTVRNAIAHNSVHARNRFEVLVRNELGTLPLHTTPGSFLLTVKPRSSPPVSFMDFYLEEIQKVADQIVPN